MSATTGLPARMRTTTDAARPMMPILIQVPTLTPSARRGTRPRSTRRRLRKEVRYAGLSMMSLMPMGLLFLSLGGARPADQPLVVAAISASEMGMACPQITLSIEPVAVAVEPTESDPVVFPGYLLPVDSPEDSAHAGR